VPEEVSFTADKQAEIDRFVEEFGNDVRALDKQSQSLLHFAAFRGRDVVIAKYFVSVGADIHALDSDAQTPLHFAARLGNVEVVKFLVSQGADVNAKDRFDDTSLDDTRERELGRFF